MKEKFFLIVGLLLAFFLQLQPLYIKNIKLDFLLLAVILFTLKYGYFKGSILGFFVGLLEDACSLQYLGVNAFANILVCSMIWAINKIIYIKRLVSCVGISFISTHIDNFLNIFLKEGLPNSISPFLINSLEESIYNGIIIGILFMLLKKYITAPIKW